MAFLDDLADRLVAQGVGVFGTNIFGSSKAVIPVGIGPYLSLLETGGGPPAGTQNDTATERPSAQLLCRASTFPAARTMLRNAYNALGGANGLHNVTLSGTFYLSITPKQSITDIGLEAGTSRAMVVFNIDVEKQPS